MQEVPNTITKEIPSYGINKLLSSVVLPDADIKSPEAAGYLFMVFHIRVGLG